MLSSDLPSETKTKTLKRIDWLTPTLRIDLAMHYPTKEGVRCDKMNHDNFML